MFEYLEVEPVGMRTNYNWDFTLSVCKELHHRIGEVLFPMDTFCLIKVNTGPYVIKRNHFSLFLVQELFSNPVKFLECLFLALVVLDVKVKRVNADESELRVIVDFIRATTQEGFLEFLVSVFLYYRMIFLWQEPLIPDKSIIFFSFFFIRR